MLQVFLGIEDKTRCSQELLTLAGCLADHLINGIANKQEKLVMLAQTPPTLLEWLRKQVHVTPSLVATQEPVDFFFLLLSFIGYQQCEEELREAATKLEGSLSADISDPTLLGEFLIHYIYLSRSS